jgi:hypothetical protein
MGDAVHPADRYARRADKQRGERLRYGHSKEAHFLCRCSGKLGSLSGTEIPGKDQLSYSASGPEAAVASSQERAPCGRLPRRPQQHCICFCMPSRDKQCGIVCILVPHFVCIVGRLYYNIIMLSE